MIVDLTATSDIRGERIRLSWTWAAPDPVRPGLRVLRRRRAYAGSVDDGLAVADLGGLFRAPDAGWARIERSQFLILNTAAEGGLVQAWFSLRFAGASDTLPAAVEIGYYDATAGQPTAAAMADITRIDSSTIDFPPWDAVETVDIFHAPGGGPETPAGSIVIFRGHHDGATPDRFEWRPSAGPSAALTFQERRDDATRLTLSSVAPEARQFVFETTTATDEGPAVVSTLALDEVYDPDTGEWRRGGVLTDHGLAGEQVYYYALFAPDPAAAGLFLTDRKWRVSAMATGNYGLENRLYDMLPAVHKQYDEPLPDRQGEGQLRAFLQIFGRSADQLRSLIEGLSLRHDTRNAPSEMLPHLARWIGWEPDLTLNEYAQRRDIRLAPDIFRTVGTVPNIEALIKRVTGWPCRAKEFVNNIFMTNAPETIRLWELWRLDHDGAAWGAPAAVTVTDGYDGGPSAVLHPGGAVWLFWHADRSGRREIWMQRPGVDPDLRRAAAGAPDDFPDAEAVDEAPAAVAEGPRIWVFYSRKLEGRWDIYARTFDGVPGNAAVPLTSHAAEDRSPAAVIDTGGQILLFWQSDRRGPTDIWARVFDGAQWGLPLRITTAAFRHEAPSAAMDGAGRIWLFWTDDLGDRRNLFYRILDGGVWGPPQPLTNGRQRDESPAAVFWNGRMRVFWHTNREGPWRVWEQVHNGVDWEAPAAVTTEVTGDKDAAAVVTAGGGLSLFFRSRRRGRAYQSRTVDTNDPEMLAGLKTFDDRTHYVYDAGMDGGMPPDEHWYARGNVGLYVTPDIADPAEVTRRLVRARDFVESFRPVPVRFVWLTDTPVTQEIIPTNGLISETFEDDIA